MPPALAPSFCQVTAARDGYYLLTIPGGHELVSNDALIARWNAERTPGTPVAIRVRDGSFVHTTTRSAAWKLLDGTPVVLLHGVAGAIPINSLRILEVP